MASNAPGDSRLPIAAPRIERPVSERSASIARAGGQALWSQRAQSWLRLLRPRHHRVDNRHRGFAVAGVVVGAW